MTIRLLLLSMVLVFLPGSAKAQLTLQQLIGSSVEKIGPEHRDIELGLQRFRSGDVAGAQKAFEQGTTKHPELGPAGVMTAQLLYSANQATAARTVLEQVVSKSPSDPQAYVMFGDLAMRSGRWTDARLLFGQSLKLSEAYQRNARRKRSLQISAQAGLAAVAEAKQEWDVAQTHLDNWIKLDGLSVAAHQRLGQAQFLLKNYKDAEQTFQKLQKLSDSALHPQANMALLYERTGRRDDATRSMQSAIRLAPAHLPTRLAAARWAINSELFSDAKTHITTLKKLAPKSLDTQLFASLLAFYQKDYKSATAILEAAHLQFPGNFQIVNQLALSLIEQPQAEQRERAVAFAQLNTRANADLRQSTGREARMTWAWVLFRAGREAEAERVAIAARNAGGVSADSALRAAKIEIGRDQKQTAAKILRAALKANPAFPQRKEAQTLLIELAKSAN